MVFCVFNFVLYLYVCGTPSCILCYIFPRLECALVFCITFFCVWNILWYFVSNITTCVTFSGILCWCFFCVERTLVLCVTLFLIFSPFCVLLYLPCFH